MTDTDARYKAAIECVRRYRHGWEARRNGSGFLMWAKAAVWESMTNDEAIVVLASEGWHGRAGLTGGKVNDEHSR